MIDTARETVHLLTPTVAVRQSADVVTGKELYDMRIFTIACPSVSEVGWIFSVLKRADHVQTLLIYWPASLAT